MHIFHSLIIIYIYKMLIYIFYWKSFREVSTLLLAYLNWPLNESYGKKSFLDPVSEPLKGLCVPWSRSGAWISTAHTFKCWIALSGLYCKTRNVRFCSNRLEKTTTFAHSFLNALSVYFLNMFLDVVCFLLIKASTQLELTSVSHSNHFS